MVNPARHPHIRRPKRTLGGLSPRLSLPSRRFTAWEFKRTQSGGHCLSPERFARCDDKRRRSRAGARLMAMRRGNGAVVAIATVLVWGFVIPMAMAAGLCTMMGALCEGPCGATLAASGPTGPVAIDLV